MYHHFSKYFAAILQLAFLIILDQATSHAQTIFNSKKPIEFKLSSPSYFREGDRVHVKAIFHNTEKSEITGQIALQVIDDSTHVSADGWFRNFFPNQFFTIEADSNHSTDFYLEIPYEYSRTVQLKLFISYNQFIDSNSYYIPVIHKRNNTTFNSTFGKYIETKEWLIRKGEKKQLLQKNPVIKIGDRIIKTIRLLNHAPLNEITVEEYLCSGTSPIVPNASAEKINDHFKLILKKNRPIQIETIALFPGTFIHSTTSFKNSKGKLLHATGSNDVIHIEEN